MLFSPHMVNTFFGPMGFTSTIEGFCSTNFVTLFCNTFALAHDHAIVLICPYMAISDTGSLVSHSCIDTCTYSWHSEGSKWHLKENRVSPLDFILTIHKEKMQGPTTVTW